MDSQGRVSGVKVEVTQLADVEGQGRVAVATGEWHAVVSRHAYVCFERGRWL